MRLFIFFIIGGVLIAAIGLVAYDGLRPLPISTLTTSLAKLLPPAPAGWIKKERPIADTPEMKQAVGELLNYDDAIFVDYINRGKRISVYLAYWKPGKMSSRLVATHTPDVCWIGNGWRKTYAAPTPSLSAALYKIPSGEDRIFTTNDIPEYVWFWHLVGGKPQSYETTAQPPWYAPVIDLLHGGLNQRREQFFIRLSSNEPLAPQLNGPVLPAVLARLPLRATSD